MYPTESTHYLLFSSISLLHCISSLSFFYQVSLGQSESPETLQGGRSKVSMKLHSDIYLTQSLLGMIFISTIQSVGRSSYFFEDSDIGLCPCWYTYENTSNSGNISILVRILFDFFALICRNNFDIT